MKKQTTTKVDISALKEFPNNPRKMPPEEMAKLKASISALGYIEPIVIDEGFRIIGGHQRVEALKQLGYKGEISAYILSGYTEAELIEANLSLNKIKGTWDFDKLRIVLSHPEINLEHTGFTLDEVSAITCELATVSIDLANTYSEPETKRLKCPKCGHVDDKENFKAQ